MMMMPHSPGSTAVRQPGSVDSSDSVERLLSLHPHRHLARMQSRVDSVPQQRCSRARCWGRSRRPAFVLEAINTPRVGARSIAHQAAINSVSNLRLEHQLEQRTCLRTVKHAFVRIACGPSSLSNCATLMARVQIESFPSKKLPQQSLESHLLCSPSSSSALRGAERGRLARAWMSLTVTARLELCTEEHEGCNHST
jgi:hypothetical protein